MAETLDDAYRELLRDYYEAKRGLNGQVSGDLSGDWRALRDRVAEGSRTHLGEEFDFGDDPYVYGREG